MNLEPNDGTDAQGADEVGAGEPLAAADRIIADFGANRVDAYFAGFAPDATFLFHTEPTRLESRDEYRRRWDEWVAESGFEVRSCLSTNRRIQVLGDVAVFTHDVQTTVLMDGELLESQERETIVLQRRAEGVWTCVHEHLSTAS